MFEKKTINALRWIVDILNRKNVPYQISGGFSAKLYGSTRSLNDIDIDIPEDRFTDIIKEVRPYITFGPQHSNDGKWDLQIMKLNFLGQEIDISGAYETKISNKDRTKWIPIPVNFSKVSKIGVESITVNVISPEELIRYKQHLDGEHQIDDIGAVKKYLKNEGRNKKIFQGRSGR